MKGILFLVFTTWRPRVQACRKKEKIPEFTEIKHLSYVILYRPGEDKSPYRHYEVWHGELSRRAETEVS